MASYDHVELSVQDFPVKNPAHVSNGFPVSVIPPHDFMAAHRHPDLALVGLDGVVVRTYAGTPPARI